MFIYLINSIENYYELYIILDIGDKMLIVFKENLYK